MSMFFHFSKQNMKIISARSKEERAKLEHQAVLRAIVKKRPRKKEKPQASQNLKAYVLALKIKRDDDCTMKHAVDMACLKFNGATPNSICTSTTKLKERAESLGMLDHA